MLKKLFYASASILMLALAYHLGATTAAAQAPGNPVVAMQLILGDAFYVATANGDVYKSCCATTGSWSHLGNVFGAPTSTALQPTWGQLKTQYRK